VLVKSFVKRLIKNAKIPMFHDCLDLHRGFRIWLAVNLTGSVIPHNTLKTLRAFNHCFAYAVSVHYAHTAKAIHHSLIIIRVEQRSKLG
jgi:hypothetical protein